MGELADARKALKKASKSKSRNVSISSKSSDSLFHAKSALKSTGTTGTASAKMDKKKSSKSYSPPSSPKKSKSKREKKNKKDKKSPFDKKALKATGAFGGGSDSSASPPSKKKPSNVFSSRKSTSTITVSKEMEGYIQKLQDAGVVASIETTPRDNDLVASMLHVRSNHDCVGEIRIDNDPRFAHLANSALLDFASGISTNFYLTSLKIHRVELGNGFLSALADSIQTNWTLDYVDLSHNAFTSDAVVDFCLGMKKNKNLRYVDLRHQRSPIQSQQEKAVLAALAENSYMKEFYIDFRTAKCQTFLDGLLARNRKKDKKLKDPEKKIVEFLAAETEKAEKEMKERDQEEEEASKELSEKDCDQFYELANLAKKYKVDLNKTEDSGITSSSTVANFLPSTNANKGLQLSKALNLSAGAMTADGSFLTADFISNYFVEDKEQKVLTFEFTNQFKLFKRFSPDDSARRTIVEKFVDALLQHPRSGEMNVLSMANTCIADDFLTLLCDRCAKKNKLQNLHQVNLETNFIKGAGLIALSNCIANPKIWKYLNSVKVDNQKSPSATQAEVALAKALCVNRTVIRFSLRVRNMRERERINRCIQRNIDFLRQARQLYLKRTGQLVKRARNKMEKLIDSIAANDPSIAEVSIVGDQTFLALNRTEILNAASCFRKNKYVTSVKMSLLKLDDKFAIELAKSIEGNASIEKVVLDNNSIGSEGITAIVASVAKNKTITELQVRHQSKPLCTTDEEKLAGLLESNETLIKFGVDLRSGRARNELDRYIRRNQDKRRKARAAANHKASTASSCRSATTTTTTTSSSKAKIKSNDIEILLQKVSGNDSKVSEVIIEHKNQEFMGMSSSQKKKFLRGLEKNAYVKRLVLDGLELDNGFAEDLASTIASNPPKLKHISVNQNEFTSPGVLAIAKAATKNKRIKSLSILKPRFKITNEDAEVFVRAMEKKSSLQKLDMDFRDDALAKRARKVLKANKKQE